MKDIVKASKLFIMVNTEESYKIISEFGFEPITVFNESKGAIWIFANKDMPRDVYNQILKHHRSVAFTDKMYFPK